MTINTESTKRIYDGNGTTTDFDYDFKIFVDTDLLVTLIDAAGNETVQVLNTDYTVTGEGFEAGGKVKFTSAPAAGVTVLIQSDVPYTQPTDYKNQGRFFPETVENNFDRAARQILQLSEENGRTIKIPAHVSGVSTMLPTPVANGLWGWDAAATEARYFTPAEIGTTLAFSNFHADTFTATAAQVDFTLSNDPGALANLDVSVDGVTQVPGDDYSVLATTLTFSAAMTGGERVLARYGTALPIGVTDASSIQFTQSGTGAVSRTMQDKGRDVINVTDFGAVGDGVADDHDAITAALAAAGGKIVYFDKAGASYVVGSLLIPSNSTLVFAPGVSLKKRLNAARILYLLNVENVTIHGNGVWLLGTDAVGSTSFSHTVTINGAKRCTIENVNIDGASSGGGGKDCVYIGKGTTACEDIVLRGGKWMNAKRNGVSIVSSKRALIDGVEITGAVGSPGAGADFEANLYYESEDNTIQNCVIHDNQAAGVFSIFGSRTTIRGCSIYNNGAYGIGVSSGGAEFNDGVYRSNIDMWGVSAFDTATGVVTVGGDLKNLPVGTPVNFSTRNGASKPAEYSASYYIVSRHVGANGVVLGTSVGKGEITSLASSGTGTLNADPALSDIRLRAFVCGQSDNYIIEQNKIYNNGAQGVYLVGSGYHTVRQNSVWDNTGSQIQAQYTKNIRIVENYVFSTDASSASVAAVACSSGGGHLAILGNFIENARGKGVYVTEWTGARIERNNLWNCAFAETSSSKAGIHLSAILNPSVIANTVRQSESNSTTLFGIYADSTATGGMFRDNNCTGAGTTNANSLNIASTTNSAENNTIRDGSKYLTGSATYDPASLADGAGVTTTVSVAGCQLGDFAEASFSNSLNGVTLTAYAQNSNVAVRFQNETGAAVDLASGTLRVRVQR